MAALSALDVDIINLHAAGTAAMMTAALEGLTRPRRHPPSAHRRHQLTSTDQERMERELLIHAPLEEVVLSYAANAAAALDGVVCSPAGGRSHPPALRGRLPDGDPRCPVRRRMPGIRSGSPPPPRPVSWALITSWWAAPSRRPRTLWRLIAAA